MQAFAPSRVVLRAKAAQPSNWYASRTRACMYTSTQAHAQTHAHTCTRIVLQQTHTYCPKRIGTQISRNRLRQEQQKDSQGGLTHPVVPRHSCCLQILSSHSHTLSLSHSLSLSLTHTHTRTHPHKHTHQKNKQHERTLATHLLQSPQCFCHLSLLTQVCLHNCSSVSFVIPPQLACTLHGKPL